MKGKWSQKKDSKKIKDCHIEDLIDSIETLINKLN